MSRIHPGHAPLTILIVYEGYLRTAKTWKRHIFHCDLLFFPVNSATFCVEINVFRSLGRFAMFFFDRDHDERRPP